MNLGHSFFDDFLTNDHKVEGALQLAVLHCGVGGYLLMRLITTETSGLRISSMPSSSVILGIRYV